MGGPEQGARGVLVIGEALIDVVRGMPHVGGSPMNVAIGTARLGLDTTFLGSFGRDAYGDMIADHLRSNGVRTLLPPHGGATSTATATLDAAGSATYEFRLDWQARGLSDAMLRALPATRLVHTGSIATVLAPGAQAVFESVRLARDRGVTVTFDPNCRPTLFPNRRAARTSAERFVQISDVVKASDEDLLWLYPGARLQEVAMDWLRKGPRLVIVTLGPGGAFAAHESGVTWVAARETEVVDTVGAGDSFMAAVIAGLLAEVGLSGVDLDDAGISRVLELASRAAGVTVSRPGADPPSHRELSVTR